MSIVFECSCGETCEIADDWVQQSVRCGKCQQVCILPAADASEEIHVEMLPDEHPSLLPDEHPSLLPDDQVSVLPDDDVIVLPVDTSAAITHPVALPPSAAVSPRRAAVPKLKAQASLRTPVPQAVLQPTTQILVSPASGQAVEVGSQPVNPAADPSLPESIVKLFPTTEHAEPFAASFSPLQAAGYQPPVEEDWSRAAVEPVHNVPRAPIELRGVRDHLAPDREPDDESNLAVMLGIVMIVAGLSQVFNPFAMAMFWLGGLIVLPLGVIALIRGIAFRK